MDALRNGNKMGNLVNSHVVWGETDFNLFGGFCLSNCVEPVRMQTSENPEITDCSGTLTLQFLGDWMWRCTRNISDSKIFVENMLLDHCR